MYHTFKKINFLNIKKFTVNFSLFLTAPISPIDASGFPSKTIGAKLRSKVG